jgi:hypothetical protein
LVAFCLTLPAATSTADRQLEAAIYREMVAGDLKGAIEKYRAILTQADTPRPIAARALFRIADCYEKLGERRQAYDAFLRLTHEFDAEASLASEARERLANWTAPPGPRNLRFEEGEPGKAPPGWTVPTVEKTTGNLVELRRTDCRSTVGCAVVTAPATSPGLIGHLMQSFSAVAYRGKTVRLRAWIKVEAGAPGDRAQMYLHVFGPNRKPGFWGDVDQRPEVPLPKWVRCEITGRIDDDAQFLDFCFSSIGHGRVWIDGVSFEVVSD